MRDEGRDATRRPSHSPATGARSHVRASHGPDGAGGRAPGRREARRAGPRSTDPARRKTRRSGRGPAAIPIMRRMVGTASRPCARASPCLMSAKRSNWRRIASMRRFPSVHVTTAPARARSRRAVRRRGSACSCRYAIAAPTHLPCPLALFRVVGGGEPLQCRGLHEERRACGVPGAEELRVAGRDVPRAGPFHVGHQAFEPVRREQHLGRVVAGGSRAQREADGAAGQDRQQAMPEEQVHGPWPIAQAPGSHAALPSSAPRLPADRQTGAHGRAGVADAGCLTPVQTRLRSVPAKSLLAGPGHRVPAEARPGGAAASA